MLIADPGTVMKDKEKYIIVPFIKFYNNFWIIATHKDLFLISSQLLFLRKSSKIHEVDLSVAKQRSSSKLRYYLNAEKIKSKTFSKNFNFKIKVSPYFNNIPAKDSKLVPFHEPFPYVLKELNGFSIDLFVLSDPKFYKKPIYLFKFTNKDGIVKANLLIQSLAVGDANVLLEISKAGRLTSEVKNILNDIPKKHEVMLKANNLRRAKNFSESLRVLQKVKRKPWQKLIDMLIKLNENRNPYYYRPVELIGRFPINPTLKALQKPCWIWISEDNEVLLENHKGEKKVVENPVIRCADGKGYLKAGLRKIWFECDKRLASLLRIRLGRIFINS